MSGNSKNDPRVAGGRDKRKPREPAKRGTGKPKAAGDVSRALRSVYDNTLREDVPADFLDLLGKLG